MKALTDLLYKEICLLPQQERKAETDPAFSSTSSTIFQKAYPEPQNNRKAYPRRKSSVRKAVSPDVEGSVLSSLSSFPIQEECNSIKRSTSSSSLVEGKPTSKIRMPCSKNLRVVDNKDPQIKGR